MKILILTRWYPSKQNDISGIFIKEQALILSSVVDITLVYINIDYTLPVSNSLLESEYERINDRLEVYRFIFARSFPIYNQLNFIFRSYCKVLKIMRDEKYDLLHCHVTFQAGIIGYLISKRTGIPFVLTEHSNWNTGFFPSRVHKWLSIYTLKKANRVIAVSEFSASILYRYIKRHYDIVYNVIDVSRFNLNKFKESSKEAQIGFLGGLDTDIKGLDILLSSISLCSEISLKLHIGGDGRLLSQFKRQAEILGIINRCVFYGKIKHEKIADFFSKLDFFVVSSRSESFGIVVIEALASGIPVLATKCGGPEEIINESVGILVENLNVNELAKGIRVMFRKHHLFQQSKLRNYVNEKFGIQAFQSNIIKVYQEEININHNN